MSCPVCLSPKPESWRTCGDTCELELTRHELSRALAELQSKKEECETLRLEIAILRGQVQCANGVITTGM